MVPFSGNGKKNACNIVVESISLTMKLHVKMLFILLTLPAFLVAQMSMDAGFQLLEQGDFAEAEDFFSAVLDKESDNRTAKICYGRAVGLNGRPAKALSIFTELDKQFPNNLEVLLNIAESYMWDKRYVDAEKLYNQLLKQDALNFTANLGAANAYAGRKDYLNALPLIERALSIQPGNPSAMVSKKFILLGIAGQEKGQWNYATAHQRLDTVNAMFPGDKDARMLRSDIFLSEQEFRSAQSVYKSLLADSIEVVRAYSGLSYTSILLKKKKDALFFAKKAMEAAGEAPADSLLRINAGIQYVNALGVSGNFKEAFNHLDKMENGLGAVLPIQMARARISIWNSDVSAGKQKYTELLNENPESFELLMGMVDVMRASQELDSAHSYLQQARRILPDQPDAFRLWQELALADRPVFDLRGTLLKDSGGNIGQNLSARAELGRMGKVSPFVMASNWRAYQDGVSGSAQQNTFMAGAKFQLNSKMSTRVTGGTTVYSDADTIQQMTMKGEIGLSFRMGKYHNFDVAYKRDLHNYTADLVRSGIALNNIALTYYFSAPTRVGLYSQYIRTFQSDGNTRNLIFTSLYYQVLEAPLLKAGFNFSSFGFERQEPEKYFSPTSSRAGEFFVQLASDRSPTKKIFYQAFIAVGFQKVSINDPQQTTRMEVAVGYRPARNLEILANYQAGNTVQSSMSGYAYQQVGLQLRYQLPVPKTDRTVK